jgi:hypothetical protein
VRAQDSPCKPVIGLPHVDLIDSFGQARGIADDALGDQRGVERRGAVRVGFIRERRDLAKRVARGAKFEIRPIDHVRARSFRAFDDGNRHAGAGGHVAAHVTEQYVVPDRNLPGIDGRGARRIGA